MITTYVDNHFHQTGKMVKKTMEVNTIIHGDALTELKKLPNECIDCFITSPPYWSLRNYQVEGQIGLELTFEEYLITLCDIFNEVKRVLKQTGTCWVNLGDTYSGNKDGKTDKKVSDYLKEECTGIKKRTGSILEKSLIMIPERFAIEMCSRGWILRNKIIWFKKNAMPSSVLDRLSNKYELVYFFAKNKKYYFDLDSIRVPFETQEKRPMVIIRAREYGYNTKQGTKRRKQEEEGKKFGKRRPPQSEYERNLLGKNPGDVWTLTLQPHKEKHIAMFPEKLIAPMIKTGCPLKGIVCDPFMGSGTTALVARQLGRNYFGIELNKKYIKIAEKRLSQQILL